MSVAAQRRAVLPHRFPAAPDAGRRLKRLAACAALALMASFAAACGGPEILTFPVYAPSPEPLPPPPPPPPGSTPRQAPAAAPPPATDTPEPAAGDDSTLPDDMYPPYDGPLPEARAPVPSSAEAAVTPETGAELTVANGRGDLIMLTIPPGAVRQRVTVRMTALNEPPANPFAKNAFAGVRMAPAGLRFARPASLRIDFAEPLANPETTWIFHVRSAGVARPLGVSDPTAFSLESPIRHFSDYTGAEPSAGEASAQAEGVASDAEQGSADSLGDLASDTAATAEMLERLGDDQAAQDLIDTTAAEAERMVQEGLESDSGFGGAGDMLDLADQMQRLGWDSAADALLDEAREEIREEARNFLDRDPPANPCGAYLNELLDMGRATTLVGDAGLTARFRSRAQEILDGCPLRGTLATEMEILPPDWFFDTGEPTPFSRSAGSGEISGSNSTRFRWRWLPVQQPEARMFSESNVDNAITGNIEVTPSFVVKLHLQFKSSLRDGWAKLIGRTDTGWGLMLDVTFGGNAVTATIVPAEIGITVSTPYDNQSPIMDLAFPLRRTATIVRIQQAEGMRFRLKLILTLDTFPGGP